MKALKGTKITTISRGRSRANRNWFEMPAKAGRSHANRFQKALDSLSD